MAAEEQRSWARTCGELREERSKAMEDFAGQVKEVVLDKGDSGRMRGLSDRRDDCDSRVLNRNESA